ncbi:hypothetical protein BDK51DRAFT_44676 [Blyttiomyces helicus]|uniref:Uncharacterized protein n=1 Tax=Blyttiomyces helicus TaxID=388810 RepID=A0A4P9WLN7_9FUNG|nr:hypothetical protein BDK51DRAFT_44676 [Blyttiomyces helicus]|eukprot:RKO93794.1 hypothetical protein BDK51DRAFT_44676 [Blyttiomyces helicus]
MEPAVAVSGGFKLLLLGFMTTTGYPTNGSQLWLSHATSMLFTPFSCNGMHGVVSFRWARSAQPVDLQVANLIPYVPPISEASPRQQVDSGEDSPKGGTPGNGMQDPPPLSYTNTHLHYTWMTRGGWMNYKSRLRRKMFESTTPVPTGSHGLHLL